MAKHNDAAIHDAIHNGLAKQHRNGVAQGAYAICKVIIDKATRNDVSDEDKIDDIIKFCSTCCGIKPENKEKSNEV